MAVKTDWARVLKEVSAEATLAFHGHTPEPMLVKDQATGQVWEIPGGPCGFAWVVIKDARSSLVRYLKAEGIGRKSYYGGWSIPSWALVQEGGSQSFERKESAVAKAVEVLKSYGVDAIAESRLD